MYSDEVPMFPFFWRVFFLLFFFGGGWGFKVYKNFRKLKCSIADRESLETALIAVTPSAYN